MSCEIEIIDPRATIILQALAEIEMISIKEDQREEFRRFVEEVRAANDKPNSDKSDSKE